MSSELVTHTGPSSEARSAAVWRTAGGSNARRGDFARPAVLAHQPARRLNLNGAIQASVVFDASGSAYAADMAGEIHAFAPDGTHRWRTSVGAGVSATPVVSPREDAVIVGTHLGEVWCLETATGGTRWKQTITSRRDPRILSDLLLLPKAGRVVVSSWGGRFHALQVESGTHQADWDAGVSPRAAASADRDENLFCLRAVGGRGIEFVRIRSDGGETSLLIDPEDSRGAGRVLVAAAPVIDEDRDRVYVVLNRERAGRLVAWSLVDSTMAWERPLPASVQATPSVLNGGAIVVSDLAGVIHGFDPDGSPRFRADLRCDYLLAGGVGLGDGRWMTGDPLGGVHVLDSDGTATTWFETRRGIQARPSFDPAGNLHLPCSDHSIYVLTARVQTGAAG